MPINNSVGGFKKLGPEVQGQPYGIPSRDKGYERSSIGHLLGSQFDAYGEGNIVTGGMGGAVAGPQGATGASLGWEHGKKADNPWEAFIAGGDNATNDVFSDPKKAILSPEPSATYLSGGIGGVLGNAGLPGVNLKVL